MAAVAVIVTVVPWTSLVVAVAVAAVVPTVVKPQRWRLTQPLPSSTWNLRASRRRLRCQSRHAAGTTEAPQMQNVTCFRAVVMLSAAVTATTMVAAHRRRCALVAVLACRMSPRLRVMPLTVDPSYAAAYRPCHWMTMIHV